MTRELAGPRARAPSRHRRWSALGLGGLLAVLAPSLRADEPKPDAAAVARMAADLNDKDLEARRKAAYALWNAGATAKPALPAIAAALRDPDEYVRTTADKVLATFRQGSENGKGGSLEAAIPELLKGLADERVEVRRLAAANLWRSGWPSAPPAPGFVAALARALDDSDPAVRATVAGTLANYAGFAAEALPTLRRRATDADKEVRLWVVQALGAAAGPDAIDVLVAATKDEDPRIRAAAAGGLGIPAPVARRAVPALVAALSDGDATVREAAAGAFVGTSGAISAPEAVPALLAMLSAEAPSTRGVAAAALGQLGDPRAVEPITHLLSDDPDATVRQQAAQALGALGPEGAESLSDLIGALGDPDAGVVSSAATAIATLGPLAREAADAVRALLRHADPNVRHAALFALGELGAPSAESRAAFFDALGDPAASVRGQAVVAVSSLGASAAPAVPTLVRLLGAASPEQRYVLLVALARLGPTAKEAAPTLRALSVEGLDRVARARALASIAATPEDVAEGVRILTGALEVRSADDANEASLAASFLAELGPAAVPARAALALRFVMQEGYGWLAAAEALIAIDGSKAVAAVERLRDDARQGHSWGITLLARRLPADPETAKILLAATSAEDPRARAAAVLGLGEVTPTSDQIRAKVTAARADPSGAVRKAAALALERIAPNQR